MAACARPLGAEGNRHGWLPGFELGVQVADYLNPWKLPRQIKLSDVLADTEKPMLQSWASLITTQRLSGTADGCEVVGGAGPKGLDGELESSLGAEEF
ncbi:hypothetical protein [Roseateles sp. P5_E11]